VAQLVSSTSYLHRDTLYVNSGQYKATAFIFGGQSPLIGSSYVIGNALKDFAQEFRLQSKPGGPLKWTAGAFYTQGKRDLRQDQPTPGFDAASPPPRTSPAITRSRTIMRSRPTTTSPARRTSSRKKRQCLPKRLTPCGISWT
jgi:hypothetical protein